MSTPSSGPDWGRIGAIAGIVGVLVAVIAVVVAHVDAGSSNPPNNSALTPRDSSDQPLPTPGSSAISTAASTADGTPLGSANSSSSAPDPAPAETPGTLRHSGSGVLISGPGLDLDAPYSNTKWSAHDSTADIFLEESGTMEFEGGVVADFIGGGPANYSICSTDPDMTGNSIDAGKIRPGVNICVKTLPHRYSAIHVNQVKTHELDLTIETYDPPDEE